MSIESRDLQLLNLGCGSHFHPAWVNVDFVSAPGVLGCNLLKGIPFPDSRFAVVYHSHVLEHFPKRDAGSFLRECFRVLKLGGVIRVVVPDLEGIAKQYLHWLELALSNAKLADENYEWIKLEMYDQTVRRVSGGDMGRYLNQKTLFNREFIRSRIGAEADNFWARQQIQASAGKSVPRRDLKQILQRLRSKIACRLASVIGGGDVRAALEEGMFRHSGEIHCWMYDRFSLRKVLEETGFKDIKVCQAQESRIPHFQDYGLDIHNGTIRKPDSLFMEAIKSGTG